MRSDQLSKLLDENRGGLPNQHALPAAELARFGVTSHSLTGTTIASAYGVLLHYTRRQFLRAIMDSGMIGRHGSGLWLTPTAYASCMVPYDLGLTGPADVALVLDPSSLGPVWGPGTAAPSRSFGQLWMGAGIEFYTSVPLALTAVLDVIDLEPCGGGH
jgi:hypothetical protein